MDDTRPATRKDGPRRGQEPWQPILDGAFQERALDAVRAIADHLHDPPPASSVEDFFPRAVAEASLAGGRAGLAVFYAYLGELGPRSEDIAAGFLSQAVDAVATVPMKASLYAGFPGVAWAVAHLGDQLFAAGEDDLTQAIDEALCTILARSPWPGDYELSFGLVGLGVYALERLSHPLAVQCLERVIDRLDELAQRRAGDVTWFTPAERLPPWQRRAAPHGYYNLGLAHGVPGVIALLGAACAAGVAEAKARPLLDGAVRWLLGQQVAGPFAPGFPSWVGPGIVPEVTRAAWCYGGLGVAAALFVAARCAAEPAWEREALRIARAAAACPPDQAGIHDAGLCHGAAGLGHIYNRLYQASGDPMLGQAARFWLERTLDMRRPGEGVAGFLTYLPGENGPGTWVAEPGILTGAAGVALVLLAAATAIEPAWDRMLLISVPPRRTPAKGQ